MMAQDTVPDPLDIRILDALQKEIPLVPRPWEEIAARLGIPEMVLLERLQRLCDAGIIRGISPIIESRPMGLCAATLVALPVPQDRIAKVAAIISRYPEVSHNFRRDHHYSLWFTLAAKDNAGIRQTLKKILSETGIPENTILNLPTMRKIKINVQFSFIRKQKEHSRGSA
jgi:DNA-binding Lrp family transcriptional regulator